MALSQNSQVLKVHDVVVDPGASKDVPPSMELQESPQWKVQEGSPDMNPKRAENVIQIPRNKTC